MYIVILKKRQSFHMRNKNMLKTCKNRYMVKNESVRHPVFLTKETLFGIHYFTKSLNLLIQLPNVSV